MFDAHTSKASREFKVVLLPLWRVNVKTTRGFIYISLEDFHMDKTARNNNITNCTIIVDRPRQYRIFKHCHIRGICNGLFMVAFLSIFPDYVR